MTNFLALYRGRSIAEAKMVAVSADPELVSLVAVRLLSRTPTDEDHIVSTLEEGRRAALRLIQQEVESESS